MHDVSIVVGTRPEIIKCAPVIRSLEEGSLSYRTIFTGQHFSDEMGESFFAELELPDPDVTIEGVEDTKSSVGRVSYILSYLEEEILDHTPETVLVQGDTDSTLTGFLAGIKSDVRTGHIEAGIRSNDMSMPEEKNRRMVDSVADLLFAPTEEAKENLESESVPGEIFVTGNTVVDAVQQHIDIARERPFPLEIDEKEEYALLTVHRKENRDRSVLTDILEGLESFGYAQNMVIVFPCHPGTRQLLNPDDVPDNVRLIEPVGYLDFLRLQEDASIIFTDSGGIQEEATVLGTPCVTLRSTTERPETIEQGFNVLSDRRPKDIVDKGEKMLDVELPKTSPYGDGAAAERIVEAIK